jgi:hypothetical protein
VTAPPTLKPDGGVSAGLIVLSRWWRAAACGLAHGTSAVRLGMVRRLIQLLEKFPPGQLRATQLLGATQMKR